MPLFIYIGFALGVFALLSNTFNYYIALMWKRLIGIVGTINAHLILSLVFFFVLFPIAGIYKLFNRDPLNLQKAETAFVTKDKVYESKDLENPW